MRDHLASPNRQFLVHTPTHTHAPKLVKGHDKAVMGHGPEDSVNYFNREGHEHPKSYNQAHNSSASVYHGLEDKYASAASGGSTVSRYPSPSPRHGSHASYYLRNHPDFDPRNPWHSCATADDAKKGKRYSSPGPTDSSSSSSSAPVPASVSALAAPGLPPITSLTTIASPQGWSSSSSSSSSAPKQQLSSQHPPASSLRTLRPRLVPQGPQRVRPAPLRRAQGEPQFPSTTRPAAAPGLRRRRLHEPGS